MEDQAHSIIHVLLACCMSISFSALASSAFSSSVDRTCMAHISHHSSDTITKNPTALVGLLTSLTTALFWMALALDPNRSVESVSLAFQVLGLALMMSAVRLLPPRESCQDRIERQPFSH